MDALRHLLTRNVSFVGYLRRSQAERGRAVGPQCASATDARDDVPFTSAAAIAAIHCNASACEGVCGVRLAFLSMRAKASPGLLIAIWLAAVATSASVRWPVSTNS